MTVKMTKASGKVHHDAGDEDGQPLAEPLANEGPRVLAFALLPLHPDEATQRKPVQRVFRLPVTSQAGQAGREPDAELVDPDARQARHDKVAHLVDEHEDDEDGQEQRDRERGVE